MSGKFCCTTAMKCAITLLTLHSTWMLFVCCSYGRPSFIKEWPQLINSSFTNPLSRSPLLRGDGGGGIMIRDLHNLLHVISLMAGKWLCNMFVYCPLLSLCFYGGLQRLITQLQELFRIARNLVCNTIIGFILKKISLQEMNSKQIYYIKRF